MVGESDGKPSQACDGNRRIAWHTFGKPERHLRKKDSTRGQRVEPGYPIGRDLAGHKTRRDAAAYILAGLLSKIAVQRIRPTGKPRAIVICCKGLNDEAARHRE